MLIVCSTLETVLRLTTSLQLAAYIRIVLQLDTLQNVGLIDETSTPMEVAVVMMR
jgi:hypothetical protein